MRKLTYLHSFGIILNQKVLHNILAFSLQKMVMTAFSCQARGALQGGTGKGERDVVRAILNLRRGELKTKGIKVE